MFQAPKIEFDGSFQCRLATDPAPSAASVSLALLSLVCH